VKGLFLDKADLDDRLPTLEPIFPGYDEPKRRAILVREHLSIKTDHEGRQGMQGFVHAQPFDVGPVEYWKPLSWHPARIVERRELDKLRLRRGLAFVDEILQRKSDPRDHHRPRLDTAVAVNAILERLALEDVFEVQLPRLGALSLDRHSPWLG